MVESGSFTCERAAEPSVPDEGTTHKPGAIKGREGEQDEEDEEETAAGVKSGWFAERAAMLHGGPKKTMPEDSNDDEFLVPSLRRADDDVELRSLKRPAMTQGIGLMPLD